MSRPSHVLLDISNPEASLPFYTQRLGMRLISRDMQSEKDATIYSLSFSTGAKLLLRHRRDPKLAQAHYQPHDSDAYWKIGITVPDVDIARERLIANEIKVSEAVQFHDIGYLCHLSDPDGYCIELLQHSFQRNHEPRPPADSEALGTQPSLGQISLDVANIDDSLAFYCDRLGMKILSRQVVPHRDFTLWFLGHPKHRPPSDSIDAVENREWLWSLPETTLELRAYNTPIAQRRAHPSADELGFRGIGISGTAEREPFLLDPDGVRISVVDD